MEKSLWTLGWHRPRGRAVRIDGHWERIEEPDRDVGWFPGETPGLWRRIADTPLDTVFSCWGPLREYGEPVALWEETLDLLQRLASLWNDPAPGQAARFVPRPGAEGILQELRTALGGLRTQQHVLTDIQLHFDSTQYDWIVEPRSLQAMLLLDAGAAVRARTRYQRCLSCDGWYEVAREDQRFCSAVCRSQHFRALTAAGAENRGTAQPRSAGRRKPDKASETPSSRRKAQSNV